MSTLGLIRNYADIYAPLMRPTFYGSSENGYLYATPAHKRKKLAKQNRK